MPMPTLAEQKRRLGGLVNDVADWGVLVYFEPQGWSDVAFLVSLIPELAGYEIVSASPDPDSYDIWKGCPEKRRLWQADWKRSQIGTWLAQHYPGDEVLKEHAKEWVEAVFARYGVQRQAWPVVTGERFDGTEAT